jgi:hypothetical protein
MLILAYVTLALPFVHSEIIADNEEGIKEVKKRRV